MTYNSSWIALINPLFSYLAKLNLISRLLVKQKVDSGYEVMTFFYHISFLPRPRRSRTSNPPPPPPSPACWILVFRQILNIRTKPALKKDAPPPSTRRSTYNQLWTFRK